MCSATINKWIMPIIGADRRQYVPLGQCIYCGAVGELTREHVVPYGLGANWVIPKATCAECAKITSRFEQSVMRGMLGTMRHQFGFRSRRDRPGTIDFNVQYGDVRERKAVPIEE